MALVFLDHSNSFDVLAQVAEATVINKIKEDKLVAE